MRLLVDIFKSSIFESLRGLTAGSGGEIQLADAINIEAKRVVEIVHLNGRRFDCGSVDGFMKASRHEYEKRINNQDG